jgi:putative MATE family efflux protein
MQVNYNGYKQIWRLVWPLMIGGLGQTLINITDTLFLGRINEVALAASAISGLFYATFAMMTFGLGSGTQILVARYYGSNNNYLVTSVFNQSNLLQLLASSGIIVLLYFSYVDILLVLISNNEVREGADIFLRYRFWGLLPLFLLTSLRSFFAGIGKTKIIGVTTFLLAAINLLLNYLLVFGYKNIPAMGIKGSAIASSIAETVAFLFIAIYTINYVKQTNLVTFYFRLDYKQVKNILTVSFPIALQNVVSLISWFLFFVIVERMGARDLAISNVIRNVYMIIMSPILAFSQASATVISHHIGLKDFKSLKKLLIKILWLSFGTTACIVIISSFMPHALMRLFTNNVSLIQYGELTLYVVLISLLFFSVSIPILSALSATGKTLVSFLIEFVTMFIYVGLAFCFALVFKLKLHWVWAVEPIYFIVIGTSAYYFFNRYIKQYAKKIK